MSESKVSESMVTELEGFDDVKEDLKKEEIR